MLEASQIKQLEAMSDEDLFAEIGQKLEQEEGLGAFPDPVRYLLKGREWFASFLPEAKTALCGNAVIDATVRTKKSSSKIAESVAAALLTSAAGLAAPVAIIAVLIVRYGIEELCEEQWAADAPSPSQ